MCTSQTTQTHNPTSSPTPFKKANLQKVNKNVTSSASVISDLKEKTGNHEIKALLVERNNFFFRLS